jgi:cell division protein FtsL
MIIARGDAIHNWDGKTAYATSSSLFFEEVPRQVNKFEILIVTAVGLLFLGTVQIALNLNIGLASGKLSNLHEIEAALRIENDRLGWAVNKAVKLEVLEKVAVNKLGMVRPETSQIVVLPK